MNQINLFKSIIKNVVCEKEFKLTNGWSFLHAFLSSASRAIAIPDIMAYQYDALWKKRILLKWLMLDNDDNTKDKYSVGIPTIML